MNAEVDHANNMPNDPAANDDRSYDDEY